MSNLRERVRRLERQACTAGRWAAIHAEIARQQKAQRRRVAQWRRELEKREEWLKDGA
jgi:hypothetical protein